jgi:hypothetical protein
VTSESDTTTQGQSAKKSLASDAKIIAKSVARNFLIQLGAEDDFIGTYLDKNFKNEPRFSFFTLEQRTTNVICEITCLTPVELHHILNHKGAMLPQYIRDCYSNCALNLHQHDDWPTDIPNLSIWYHIKDYLVGHRREDEIILAIKAYLLDYINHYPPTITPIV